MERLKDRVAIVTGAAQGIGKALALGLSREGAKLVIADIHQDNAIAVKDEICATGAMALAILTDVSDEMSVEAMVEQCVEEFGKIDILINNAGIFPVSSVEDMQEEEWDHVIGTNLVGAFLSSKAVVSKLIEQESGRIISISSGRAFQGAKNAAHYASSKAGIIGFSKALALELAPHRITEMLFAPVSPIRPSRAGTRARNRSMPRLKKFPWAESASRKIWLARLFFWQAMPPPSSPGRRSSSMAAASCGESSWS
jgi:NAD(P)-dependent dehydrogenase (short-subunit alcohol dehydrogenase family)